MTPFSSPSLADLIVGTMYNHETAREDANIITSVSNPSVAYFVFTVPTGYDGAYVTVTFVPTSTTATPITSLSEISNDLTGTYELAADIDASGVNRLGEFTGTLAKESYLSYTNAR